MRLISKLLTAAQDIALEVANELKGFLIDNGYDADTLDVATRRIAPEWVVRIPEGYVLLLRKALDGPGGYGRGEQEVRFDTYPSLNGDPQEVEDLLEDWLLIKRAMTYDGQVGKKKDTIGYGIIRL
jgi:hypothetical protein